VEITVDGCSIDDQAHERLRKSNLFNSLENSGSRFSAIASTFARLPTNALNANCSLSIAPTRAVYLDLTINCFVATREAIREFERDEYLGKQAANCPCMFYKPGEDTVILIYVDDIFTKTYCTTNDVERLVEQEQRRRIFRVRLRARRPGQGGVVLLCYECARQQV